MSSPKTTTVKVSLKDIETINWALYCLDRDTLSTDQQQNLKRLVDRLDRAEERVL